MVVVMKTVAVLAIGFLALFAPVSAGKVVVEKMPLPDTTTCVTDAEWAEWRATGEANLARLAVEDKLPPVDRTLAVQLQWPLLPGPSFIGFGYHAISSFPDHDPRYPDLLSDYECGTRTYDTPAGVNHNGTDYVLYPFSWYKMDHDEVEIVAGVGGVIFDRADGFFDRSCTPGGSTNKVAILHDDGSRAYYIHMKSGSVTSKGIGESVVAGEYLGVVGSSGNSNIPHLHLDFRDANWNTVDAWSGACNPGTTWWADQRPYHDSAILALLTHSAPPEYPPCPEQEILNLRDDFLPGETVYYGIYHRDLLAGQLVEYSLLRPDDSVADSGSYSITDPHYPAAAALPEYLLPAGTPAGVWKAVVDYQGQRYEHPFTVRGGGAPAAGSVPDGMTVPGTPLRVDPAAGGEVTLSWGGSCLVGDTDYEIYSGTLGQFTTHDPVTCSTAGATTSTFAPQADSRYFLVVPTNGAAEGSYGSDSSGTDRQPVAGACLAQLSAACP